LLFVRIPTLAITRHGVSAATPSFKRGLSFFQGLGSEASFGKKSFRLHFNCIILILFYDYDNNFLGHLRYFLKKISAKRFLHPAESFFLTTF